MSPIEQQIEGVVDRILQDYRHDRDIDKMDLFRHPDKEIIIDIIQKLQRIVFPGYSRDKNYRIYNAKHNLSMLIEDVMFNLNRQITLVLQLGGMGAEEADRQAQETSLAFFARIPEIRDLVQMDLKAAYDGDPAATSMAEIIFSYPGLFAIMVFRLAHALWELKVPLLPRIMTEYAHSVTGIDIHPGATIGKYFFIDHGTGIVIGETSVIGSHVKLYQGVTLGALSPRAGHASLPGKRHPTVCDDVTIYSGASILGGQTVIGEHTVVGGNAFLTSSVADNTHVVIHAPEMVFKNA